MTPTCGARSRLDSARLQFGAEAGRAAALPGMAEVAPPRRAHMTKTPTNPAPMAMCNSARSTVEWVGRPTPLPSRAASRLRLESALALKPAEWGGAPPLLSRRAARAPLRAARYATSHNHQPTTPPRTYLGIKTPSRHNHPVVSVGRVGHAASRARAAAVAVAVAVAVARRGVRRRRALRRRCVAQLARSTAEAATGASKRTAQLEAHDA